MFLRGSLRAIELHGRVPSVRGMSLLRLGLALRCPGLVDSANVMGATTKHRD